MRAYEKNPVPRELFGYGSSEKTGERLKALGVKRALIVTDQGLMKFNVAPPIIQNIKDAGIQAVVFDAVEADAPDLGVYECLDIIRSKECDAIVAIGGGSVIDTAKVAGIFTGVPDENPKVSDYCVAGGKMRPTYQRKDLIAVYIPTTSGTGAEATTGGVIHDTSKNLKVGVLNEHELPDLTIIDPALTMNLPKSVTVNTGVDAIAHCIEHLIGLQQLDFQDLILFECAKRAWQWLPIVAEDPSNREGREQLSWAAHQALCNGGFSNGHGVAQTIGGIYHQYKLVHGATCAWVIPTLIRWEAESRAAQIVKLADCFGVPVSESDCNADIAGRVAEAFRKYCRDLGIKSLKETFEEKGIPDSREEFIRKMADAAPAEPMTRMWVPVIHEDRQIMESILGEIWDEE